MYAALPLEGIHSTKRESKTKNIWLINYIILKLNNW